MNLWNQLHNLCAIDLITLDLLSALGIQGQVCRVSVLCLHLGLSSTSSSLFNPLWVPMAIIQITTDISIRFSPPVSIFVRLGKMCMSLHMDELMASICCNLLAVADLSHCSSTACHTKNTFGMGWQAGILVF